MGWSRPGPCVHGPGPGLGLVFMGRAGPGPNIFLWHGPGPGRGLTSMGWAGPGPEISARAVLWCEASNNDEYRDLVDCISSTSSPKKDKRALGPVWTIGR